MADGTVVFLPSNGANIHQATHENPGTAVIQPPGMMQYVQYGSKQFGSPSNPPQQNPQMGSLEKFLKAEAKTLGTIQILIGLIHIGFGSVSATLSGGNYSPLAAIGGYPFWGGVFFIISGSLSVSAEKNQTFGLVKSSVGMNITSAIMALTGIILFSVELAKNSPSSFIYYQISPTGTSLCILLLLFSLLEFCITASTAHFGCQVACCNNDPQALVFVPYTISSSAVAPSEGSSAPPPLAYNAADASSK